MQPNRIPFGGEATSSFFHLPFVSTKFLPQSDVFSVQVPIPTRITKEMWSVWCPVSTGNGWIRPWATRLSASHSTLVHLAIGTPLAILATPALYVVASLMDPINVMPDDIFPIIIKLKLDAWECATVAWNFFHCHAYSVCQITTCYKKMRNLW